MEFQEITAPTIGELFQRQIIGMILSGALRPGDRLPTERELAAQMRVSKTVVHEGIRELSRQGFLDVASRRGVTVANYSLTGNLETLTAIMNYHGGRMSSQTVRSLLMVRCYLEGPAMRELAAHHIASDIARLEQWEAAAAAAASEGARALADAFFDYHRGLTYLSGNSITPLIFNAFRTVCINSWMRYVAYYGAVSSLERLHTFTACIRSGDGAQAERILQEGLEDFLRHTDDEDWEMHSV